MQLKFIIYNVLTDIYSMQTKSLKIEIIIFVVKIINVVGGLRTALTD